MHCGRMQRSKRLTPDDAIGVRPDRGWFVSVLRILWAMGFAAQLRASRESVRRGLPVR